MCTNNTILNKVIVIVNDKFKLSLTLDEIRNSTGMFFYFGKSKNKCLSDVASSTSYAINCKIYKIILMLKALFYTRTIHVIKL